MSIIVLPSFCPFFSFFELSFVNLHPLYSRFKGIKITSLFRKLTKVSKNNFVNAYLEVIC